MKFVPRMGLVTLCLFVLPWSWGAVGAVWKCADWRISRDMAVGERVSITEVQWLNPTLLFDGTDDVLKAPGKLKFPQQMDRRHQVKPVPIAILGGGREGRLRFVSHASSERFVYSCMAHVSFEGAPPAPYYADAFGGYINAFGGNALVKRQPISPPLQCMRDESSHTLVSARPLPDAVAEGGGSVDGGQPTLAEVLSPSDRALPDRGRPAPPGDAGPREDKTVARSREARPTEAAPGGAPGPIADLFDDSVRARVTRPAPAATMGSLSDLKPPASEGRVSPGTGAHETIAALLDDKRKPVAPAAPAVPSPGPAAAQPPPDTKPAGAAEPAPAAPVPAPPQEVCDAAFGPLATIPSFPVRDLSLAGLRGDQPSARAYWSAPEIKGVIPQKFQFDLGISKRRLVPVDLADGDLVPVLGEDGKDPILPVRFAGLIAAPRFAADATARPPEHANHLLLVGDAATVLLVGFAEVERALIARGGDPRWRIAWHDVAPDGTLAPARRYVGFSELLKAVAGIAAAAERKVLLDAPDDFARFIAQTQAAILAAEQLDYVIWVKEGYQLPLSAPELVSGLIAEAHAKARLQRLPTGRARRWLTIISGQIPGASRAFLEEPVARATPDGDVLIEKRAGEARRLLERPESLALQLHLVAERGGAPDARFEGDPPETMVVDAAAIFDSLGLVISRAGLRDLLGSMDMIRTGMGAIKDGKPAAAVAAAFAGPYDPTLLQRPQSTADGELRGLRYDRTASRGLELRLGVAAKDERALLLGYLDVAATTLRGLAEKPEWGLCTHLYLPDTQLGLDWRRAPTVAADP